VLFNLSSCDSQGRPVTVDNDVVEIFVMLNTLIMYASALESTERDRADQAACYNRLLDLICQDDLFTHRAERGYNWPRLHAVGHYPSWTLRHGVPSHLDTSAGKTAHSGDIKKHYSHSNKCDATIQIINGNLRFEMLRAFRLRLETEGLLKPDATDIIPPLVYPSPTYSIAARATADGRRIHCLAYFEQSRCLPGLVRATKEALQLILAQPCFQVDGDLKCESYTRFAVTVPEYARGPFLTPNNCRTLSFRINATTNYTQ